MQSKIKQRLLANLEDKYRKILFQKKTQRFGFNYWTKQKDIKIKDHVKLYTVDLPEKKCTESELKAAISGLCNLDLPHGNSTNWEVALLDKNVETNDGLLSAVLIRIHHSVGDGYALVDLFLNVLTDSEKNNKDDHANQATVEYCEDYNYQNAVILDKHRRDPCYPGFQSSKEKCKFDSNCDNLKSIKVKELLSEVPLEKSFKSKLFNQNMAKVNWNSLKTKTKIFINMRLIHSKEEENHDSNNSETLRTVNADKEQEVEKFSPEKYTLTNFKDKGVINDFYKITDSKASTLEPEEQIKYLNNDKKVMKLDLRDQAIIPKPNGTLFMNDMYYTPSSPNSSMILDCFSCKSKIKPRKSLLHLQMLIKYTQTILNYEFQLLFPLLYRTTFVISILVKEFSKICFLPANMIIKRIDKNRLHNNRKPLTQRKALSYMFDDNLFEMIKHIKTVRNIKFNEVVLRCVSDSLEMYFKDSTESVNVIVPVPISTKRSTMKNDFTVCIFDLSIRCIDKTRSIHNKYLELYRNYEPTLTYYILKYIIDSIPNCLLRYVVRSRHSTLVLSNMVGPDHQIFFSGHEIKRLSFFVPNKDTTGVGITLLSYNNQLSLGVIMDESLGDDNKEDANEILENMKNSIYHMYAECFE